MVFIENRRNGVPVFADTDLLSVRLRLLHGYFVTSYGYSVTTFYCNSHNRDG